MLEFARRNNLESLYRSTLCDQYTKLVTETHRDHSVRVVDALWTDLKQNAQDGSFPRTEETIVTTPWISVSDKTSLQPHEWYSFQFLFARNLAEVKGQLHQQYENEDYVFYARKKTPTPNVNKETAIIVPDEKGLSLIRAVPLSDIRERMFGIPIYDKFHTNQKQAIRAIKAFHHKVLLRIGGDFYKYVFTEQEDSIEDKPEGFYDRPERLFLTSQGNDFVMSPESNLMREFKDFGPVYLSWIRQAVESLGN